MCKFVGRSDSVNELIKIIEEDFDRVKLKIQSIEGPAGIGKSTLFDHCIKQEQLDEKSFLVLRIDGNSSQSKDPVDIICDLLLSAKAYPIQNKQAGQIFPYTTNMIKYYKDFQSELLKEYEKKNPNEDSEKFINSINRLVSIGKGINSIFPKTAEYINAENMETQFSDLKTPIQDLTILAMETVGFIQKLTLTSDKLSMRNQFRLNPLIPLSQSLFNDLSAILDKPIEKSKPSPSKIKGIDRLLLVIDDYEALQPIISDFLTQNFLKSLKNAGFLSTVVIIGRDSLTATSVDWNQYFDNNMCDPIVLQNLSKKEVLELSSKFGILEVDQQEKIWNETNGYPYYIQLWKEEAQSGGLSSVKLKQFYNRTTRWMTKIQKEWLESIVFLDTIDVQTIGDMGLKNPQEVKNWFQDEGSIRDPNANPFKFRAFVKSRILEHIKNSDPTLYKNNLKQAKFAISKSNELNEELSSL
ncbi:hypothetical protein [Acinetobacter sp. ANC 3832]|uniref:hypothetical protein n=1 Tax=Acinetobacter sp. ANC 3832 TaxID=1977874 RepID=UPI000A336FDA|nr:hypothetical protein [Acinetobacter sp. ANC 3832]OTG95012.1 hypothetical protein B9T35_06530 [Acinetobacter sp. ANC 3832]